MLNSWANSGRKCSYVGMCSVSYAHLIKNTNSGVSAIINQNENKLNDIKAIPLIEIHFGKHGFLEICLNANGIDDFEFDLNRVDLD